MDTPPPLPVPGSSGQSPAVIRALGWVLIVLGPLISAGMVALTLFLAPLVNAPTLPGHSPRYNGSHAMTVAAFSLFGALFVFGLLALANGVYQARYARRSIPLMVLFILTLVGIIATGVMVALANAGSPTAP